VYQKIADRLKMTPYVVHATFQFSGTPGKRHRFREALMWVVSKAGKKRVPSSFRSLGGSNTGLGGRTSGGGLGI